MSTVPALHKYSFIKEGSCITLYNVHCLVAKEVNFHSIKMRVRIANNEEY